MTPPAAATAGRALPRTAVPRAPRRVSGPARPAARTNRSTGAPTARRAAAGRAADPLAVRALRRARVLADSRLLDRLVRGRLWIPLVAAGLMGIVFMQVSMLKLNAGIGRAVQSASTLERQNANLRSDISRMESGDRIDSVAQGLGMVVPADGSEHYVRAGAGDTAARAAATMSAPDPAALARAQAATAATVTAAGGQSTTLQQQAPAAATGTATTAAASPITTTAAVSTGTTAASPPASTPAAAPVQQSAPPVQPSAAPSGATSAPAATPSSSPAATAAATAGGAAAPTGY
jgi:hypothetical protein